MAKMLTGAPVARALDDETRERTEVLRLRDCVTTLAVVRVGARPDDLAYERGAVRRCEGCGVMVRRCTLPLGTTQPQLLREIERLNQDDTVHGILLLHPLPYPLNDAAACAAIAPEKDVDGVTAPSMARLLTGNGPGFAPCTAEACLRLLEHYRIPLEGANAVVVGRSLVVGKPAALLLLQKNATVTLCHTKTVQLPRICRAASLLLVAAGRRGLVDAGYLAPGQTVVDVGIHTGEDGNLCGDVRTEQAAGIVAGITPVPGGVGAVTTSVLAAHVTAAAERRTAAVR